MTRHLDPVAAVPTRPRPCAECPWRRDTPPGQFTPDRYDALSCTSGGPGREAPIGAPLFACHKSRDDNPAACAGWLAVCGADHLGVRLAVARRHLDPAALAPGPDWPPLFDSYEQMAATQGGHTREPMIEYARTPTRPEEPHHAP